MSHLQDWHRQQTVMMLMQKTKESSGMAATKQETWYDLNDGIILSTLWVKNLFKLVEKKA